MQSLRCEGKDWHRLRFDHPQSQQPLRIGDEAAVVSESLFLGGFAELRVLCKLNAKRGGV